MKKIFLIVGILLLIGLGFCGHYAFKKYVPSDTNKTLVFWSIQLKPVYKEPILKVIEEFEQNHPDYKVVWVDIPIQEAQKRTLASLLSSNPPDLINLNPDFSILLAQRNALYTFDEDDVEQFHPKLVERLKYNGSVYALPFYATSPVTIYNKEILKDCKVDINKINTFDDLYEASKKKDCSTPLFASSINENDAFSKILNKYDISNFADEVQKQEAIKVYSIFDKLYKSNNLPKDVLALNHREVVERYMAQKAAIIVAGSNFINAIKNDAPSTYAVSGLKEQLTGKNRNYDIALMNLIIPKKSKNIEEALDFALLLTNEENQMELSRLTNVIPANKYALNNDYFKTKSNDLYEKARNISASQLNRLNEVNFGNDNKKVINEEINSKLEEILLNLKSDDNFIKERVEELSEAIKKLQKGI